MAAGAIGFAGLMVVEGNHKPDVFGLKYLAIYAQPRMTAKPAGARPGLAPSLPLAAESTCRRSVRSAPIRRRPWAGSSRPSRASRGCARDSRIVAVRPGNVRAGLGRIVDVAQRD